MSFFTGLYTHPILKLDGPFGDACLCVFVPVDDAIESLFDDDEEEEDAIVSQVHITHK